MNKVDILELEKKLLSEINLYVKDIKDYNKILGSRSFLSELLELASITSRLLNRKFDQNLKLIYLKHLITMYIMNNFVLITSNSLKLLYENFSYNNNFLLFESIDVSELINSPYFSPFTVNDKLIEVGNTVGILCLRNADLIWKDFTNNKYFTKDIVDLFSILPKNKHSEDIIRNFIELQVYLLVSIFKYNENQIKNTLNYVFRKVPQKNKKEDDKQNNSSDVEDVSVLSADIKFLSTDSENISGISKNEISPICLDDKISDKKEEKELTLVFEDSVLDFDNKKVENDDSEILIL